MMCSSESSAQTVVRNPNAILLQERSSQQSDANTPIITTLLVLMDGVKSRGNVLVIAATNRLDAIDGALRRPGRFDRELRFTLPTSEVRLGGCWRI